MADELTFRARAKEFFQTKVHPWWRDVVCAWPLDLRKHSVELLLAGIYLSLQQLLEATGQGTTYFNIVPFQLVAGAQPIKILDKEVQGRVRDITVWFDSALGGPPATVRIGTSDGGAGNGVLVTMGIANELGKVPPQTTLFASSNVTINGYLVEHG